MAVWWWETTKEGGFQLYVPWSSDKTQPKKSVCGLLFKTKPPFYTAIINIWLKITNHSIN